MCFGRISGVERLLGLGADVNYASGEYEETALMRAATSGSLEMVGLLIERGADVEARAKYGHTALISASFLGRMEVVMTLIEHGAEVNAKDNDGRSTLMEASRAGAKVSLDFLLNVGRRLMLVTITATLPHTGRY